ncbi:uncharacterized protein LOC132167836 [Corylus avellana]|uniref:uncharacterized protein LOC132167836 n=1 Tax=Corylus avellana TaxID=13451 RepID=UPI00286CC44B|nr:uncharacterized protein LOC132167836 [Corylus avellana]
MSKFKTIDSFFKRKEADISKSNTLLESNAETSNPNERHLKSPRVEDEEHPFESPIAETQEIYFKSSTLNVNEVDVSSISIERDPGLRPPMWDYPVNRRDEIRRAYLKHGPNRFILANYPLSGPENHPRRFQASWFTQFPWLEYSRSKDAAYCLPCYLFTMKRDGRPGWDVFTIKGFRNWRKVHEGKNCAFLTHIGEDPCSPHNNAMKSYEDLRNQSRHIDKVLNAQSMEQIQNNRLRVKTSIDATRWLAFQGCASRGHDETVDSKNRGNFLELIKLLASYNDKVASVVLENAPKSARYISHTIQKEILQVIASKVREKIREDIGDSKFCIIVDEARDESKREQMAIVLRFVDKDGFIQERFFDIVHVKDTSTLTLKNGISDVLFRYCLDIQNIRGQGYDGANCSCAYYVHCFAHRLQLALVAASREVSLVHVFFTNLNFVINVASASCKRHDQLQAVHATQIAHMEAIGELETGKGANQIGTLKRAGDSRWGSHFNSICSLIRMFDATCTVLEDVEREGGTYSQRGDAKVAYKMLTSFEFIFILHLMKEIMGITDVLCQVLQQKSQDILNAINSVSIAKKLIQKLRDDGWDNLLENIVSFSKKAEIGIPDLSAPYIEGRGRSQKNHITLEHHYHFDIFNTTIDFQLQELDSRFGEKAMELLTLSSALNPKDAYESFKIDDICILAEKYYPLDFSEQEKINLRYQLRYFEVDVLTDPTLQNLSSIAELCQGLAKAKKSKTYDLIDRLIRLVLTLPVSTATTERAFSAMKIVKTRLRNKMEDDFLANSLVLYIEREIAESFDLDSILDDFVLLKDRKVQF